MARVSLRILLAVTAAAVSAACCIVQGARAAAAPGSLGSGGSAAQPGGNPLWTIPLNALTATRERPIFLPSRRPPMAAVPTALAVPPPPTPVAAAPEQLALQLLGTIAGKADGIAICLNQTTSEVIRVRTGEAFEGWLLSAVRGREATFVKAGRQTVLVLPSPDDPQPGAPPQIPVARATAPPPPVASQPAATPVNASRGGTWRDGDGNLIDPPKR